MYGKRHPRIHLLDLLNIKVPCPDLPVQEKIVGEISKIEEHNFQTQERIDNLLREAENVIWAGIKE